MKFEIDTALTFQDMVFTRNWITDRRTDGRRVKPSPPFALRATGGQKWPPVSHFGSDRPEILLPGRFDDLLQVCLHYVSEL